jgi:hypothetical protein
MTGLSGCVTGTGTVRAHGVPTTRLSDVVIVPPRLCVGPRPDDPDLADGQWHSGSRLSFFPQSTWLSGGEECAPGNTIPGLSANNKKHSNIDTHTHTHTHTHRHTDTRTHSHKHTHTHTHTHKHTCMHT